MREVWTHLTWFGKWSWLALAFLTAYSLFVGAYLNGLYGAVILLLIITIDYIRLQLAQARKEVNNLKYEIIQLHIARLRESTSTQEDNK